MERDKGPRSCIIPHIARPGTEVTRLRGCSEERCAESSDHFMGRHTTSVENVEYTPVNVKTFWERCRARGEDMRAARAGSDRSDCRSL
jgi:hypothetical protein